MSSKFLGAGVLAALLLTSGVASAQVTTPTVKVVANNQFRAKQVLGTSIMIQGNTAVGIVDDLVFDDAGNLEYMIVSNEGKLVTVPWEAAKFDLEKKSAVLTITPDQYRTIPTYTPTTYPSFYTPTYRNEVYKYYGLNPRDLRRIDRINR